MENLNRLVHRVRRVVHQRVFGQVLERLAQTDGQRPDDLLKTTEIVQRQSVFQDLKEGPKKPTLTHLEHTAWETAKFGPRQH